MPPFGCSPEIGYQQKVEMLTAITSYKELAQANACLPEIAPNLISAGGILIEPRVIHTQPLQPSAHRSPLVPLFF